jgi:hypothetical protein
MRGQMACRVATSVSGRAIPSEATDVRDACIDVVEQIDAGADGYLMSGVALLHSLVQLQLFAGWIDWQSI